MKGFVLFLTLSSFLLSHSTNAQWVQTNGPFGSDVISLHVNGSNLYLSTNYENYISTNNGTNWTLVDSSLSGSGRITSLVKIGSNLFAGTEYGKSGVYLSTNNGTNWTLVNSGLNYFLWVNILAVKDSNLFAGVGDEGGGGIGGIFLSTNNGTNWTDLGIPASSVNSLAFIGTKLFAGCGDRAYGMGASEGGLFYSTDNGLNWTNTGLRGICTKNSIIIIGEEIFVQMTSFTMSHGYSDNTYLSSDNGTNWKLVNSYMPLAFGPDGKGGTNLYSYNFGVSLSTDNGTSWISIGLTNMVVYSLAVLDTNLFAGTNRGLWRCSISRLLSGTEDKKNNLPSSFLLSQNYPNPFNPSTTIKYAIPKSERVMIKIYNLLGKEVATLVNGNKAAGEYNVNFNGSNFASGIYFYRITAGSFRDTKKLILLK